MCPLRMKLAKKKPVLLKIRNSQCKRTWCWYFVGELLQLAYEETIHVVFMRIVSPCQVHRGMKTMFTKAVGNKNVGNCQIRHYVTTSPIVP